MALEYTFQQVKEFVKKDQPQLIDAVDKLLGLTLVCSPIVLGPAAAPLLGLLSVKNELTKIGTSLFTAITGKKDSDFLVHQERLRAAYTLISYTAYFEALDRKLPASFRRKLNLSAQDKESLLKARRDDGATSPDSAVTPATKEVSRHSLAVAFPHPVQNLDNLKSDLKALYGHLSKGMADFFEKLALWDEASKSEKEAIEKVLKALPDAALGYYEAQYAELAMKFEDFAVWANLHEHKSTRTALHKLSSYVQQRAALAEQANTDIDVGFAKVRAAVNDIPRVLDSTRAIDIVSALQRHYEARVNEQIIEDKYEAEEGKPRLSFPKIKDAFIPQSYRATVYTSKTRRLESEDTWQPVPARQDLGAFLLSYLSSPYSIENPLIILGHPGSGKSLLTKVLSATLLSEQYTPIRVALREVDSEASIPSQVEQYINSVTSDRLDSWARFSSHFKNTPPVIILDGYDELLQASGKVFSGYLKDARHFQRGESEQGRPVRIIVTSRLTLIDKASVPEGATIIRLLEFDKRQRDAWISIWNSENSEYFANCTPPVTPFTLPDEKEPHSKSILGLAEQPLLLLMLALYDSEDNRLRQGQGIDRTVLYESLLRRFVLRERKKQKEFDTLPQSQQDSEIDRDLQRLGVAAIGMYNRRKLHILSSELEEDVKCFEMERQIVVENGRPLSQADMLLGSFFFVHKSKLLQKTEEPNQYEETSAFEFLHNTFGEFLTADFILRQAVSEVQLLSAFRTADNLKAELTRRLDRPDAFSKAWFASLIYTPLFSRPVVVEMLREWAAHYVKVKKLPQAEFLAGLDEVVLNQIQRVLLRRHMPPLIRGDMPAPFPRHPLIGHLAIYTVNLVILRAVLSTDAFVFDESTIGTHEDGSRPWDQLTHLWRSWFSLENLNGLTAVFSATRSKEKDKTGREKPSAVVRVTPKTVLQVSAGNGRLDTILNVNSALADNIGMGLAGLLAYNPGSENRFPLSMIADCLESEGIDARLQIIVKALLDAKAGGGDQPDRERAYQMLGEVLGRAMEAGRLEELHVALGLIATRYRWAGLRVAEEYFHARRHMDHRIHPDAGFELVRMLLSGGRRRYRGFDDDDRVYWSPNDDRAYEYREFGFLHPRQVLELVERMPELGIEVLRFVSETGPTEISRYWRELEEHLFRRGFLEHLAERNFEAALDLVDIFVFSVERPFGFEMAQEAVDRLERSGRLEDVARRRPELIVALSRLAHPEASASLLQRFTREIFDGILATGALIDIVERRPDAAVILLRHLASTGESVLTAKAKGQRRITDRLLYPPLMIQIGDRNETAASEFLRLLRGVFPSEVLERYFGELCDILIRSRRLGDYVELKPLLMLELLRFSRGFEPRLTNALTEVLSSVLKRPERLEAFVRRAPFGLLGQTVEVLEGAGDRRTAHLLQRAVASIVTPAT